MQPNVDPMKVGSVWRIYTYVLQSSTIRKVCDSRDITRIRDILTKTEMDIAILDHKYTLTASHNCQIKLITPKGLTSKKTLAYGHGKSATPRMPNLYQHSRKPTTLYHWWYHLPMA